MCIIVITYLPLHYCYYYCNFFFFYVGNLRGGVCESGERDMSCTGIYRGRSHDEMVLNKRNRRDAVLLLSPHSNRNIMLLFDCSRKIEINRNCWRKRTNLVAVNTMSSTLYCMPKKNKTGEIRGFKSNRSFNAYLPTSKHK